MSHQPSTREMSGNTALAAVGLAILSFLGIAGGLLLAWILPFSGAWGMVWFGGAGLIAALSAGLETRLRSLAQSEAEAEKRHRERVGGQLFDAESMTGSHQRAHAAFERVGTRLTALLLLFLFVGGISQLLLAETVSQPAFSNPVLLICGLAVFTLLIAGRAVGVLFRANPYLRTAAGLTVLQGLFLAIIAGLSGILRFTENVNFSPDPIVLNIGIAILAILALDMALGLLLSFYRAPATNATFIPACESRIAALLTGSGHFMSAMRDLLEYQFGIVFSREELIRHIKRGVVPLVLLEAVLLMAVSTVVVIPSDSIGYRTRLGAVTGESCASGLHFKLPWPFADIHIVPAGRIDMLTIGAPDEGSALWRSTRAPTDKSAGDGIFQIVGENLIESSLNITYSVDTPYHYHLVHTDGRAALAQLAWQSFLESMTASTNAQLLTGTDTVCSNVQARLQRLADASELGVTVRQVSFNGLQPSSVDAVAGAFRQRGEASIVASERLIRARGESKTLVADAQTDAEKSIAKARLEASASLGDATMEAEVFKVRAALMKRYGALYAQLLSLETLDNAYADARKLFLAIRDPEARKRIRMSLDLKDESGPTFLDAANPN